MRISFFEEFPNKDNLDKIKYVKFPTKLYIAATSLKDFESIKIESKNVKQTVYWPILKDNEGYWFSAFTDHNGIKRIIRELKKSDVPIMVDLELPSTHNPTLYITQLPHFFSNRKKLKKLISSRKEVYTAEYLPSSQFSFFYMRLLGLSFRSKNHRPIKMLYSSMHNMGETLTRHQIKKAQKLYGDRLCMGLGTLCKGILGFEPTISPEILDRDLRICKELGVKEVIIFRLGGMNKKYAKILEKYV